MSVVQNEALKYTTDVASHPSYRMSRILPDGNQTETLSATNIVETEIRIPQKVFNLSKSTLDFQLEVSESSTATYFNNLYSLGLTMIDSIELLDRASVPIAEIRNCNRFTRAVTPYVTKMEDFLSMDSSLGGATSDLSQSGDKGQNFFPCNALQDSTAGALLTPSGTRVVAGLSVAGDRSYTEPQYIVQGAARNGSAAGDIFINYSIPLSAFHHTVLAQNKDLYFGQSLNLRIHWAPTNVLGFGSSAAGNFATVENLHDECKINNIRLYLAVETNNQIKQMLINKVSTQGLSLTVPYVHSYVYNSPSATSSSDQRKFNRGHGQRLLNLYHCVYHNTTTGVYAFDINNLANAKVISFQSQLDNVNMQEIVVTSNQGEDYAMLKDKLKNSVIQSNDIYKYNRVWIESWRDGKTCEWPSKDDVADGLDLNTERIYNINLTTVEAGFRQYMFAVVQRTLNISPDGSVTMN